MTQAAQSKTKTIAVFATGIMRAAIARNLKENGFNVNVWNRSYEK
ncbi:NAD(P)-binding domain-containing protein [Acinetobacter sp. ANC 4910]|nr:NAD(P)-binding domain-containing protein [Acinetobacter sp. ANC 4910]